MLVGFDTNVLVYTLRARGNLRLEQAADLMHRAVRSRSAALLLQSLTEFSHVAIRKLRLDAKIVRRHVVAFREAAPCTHQWMTI